MAQPIYQGPPTKQRQLEGEPFTPPSPINPPTAPELPPEPEAPLPPPPPAAAPQPQPQGGGAQPNPAAAPKGIEAFNVGRGPMANRPLYNFRDLMANRFQGQGSSEPMRLMAGAGGTMGGGTAAASPMGATGAGGPEGGAGGEAGIMAALRNMLTGGSGRPV